MTKDQALDIFIKHSQFFEIYVQAKYVPRALEGILNEVLAAYSVINPGYSHCGGCNDPYFIIDANRYRVAELKRRELKAYTFPKQNKDA
jgi:hypothetical protein